MCYDSRGKEHRRCQLPASAAGARDKAFQNIWSQQQHQYESSAVSICCQTLVQHRLWSARERDKSRRTRLSRRVLFWENETAEGKALHPKNSQCQCCHWNQHHHFPMWALLLVHFLCQCIMYCDTEKAENQLHLPVPAMYTSLKQIGLMNLKRHS